jgi:Protein kinase domain
MLPGHADRFVTSSDAYPDVEPIDPDDPTAVSRFVSGTIVAGRYRIVALLGRGGMGEVYRADDLKLRQEIALKFMPDSFALSARALARFHAEVRLARRVSHANVCRVYDVGEVDGLHFLTMEFIDGEDLASLLRRIGRLPGERAIEIIRQMCAGLAATHDAGVIHRDLKPANVMIDSRGRARLTDFGVAAVARSVSGAAEIVGTPGYMAPEQARGGSASIRSDIYSLGLVAYELLTGTRADAVVVSPIDSGLTTAPAGIGAQLPYRAGDLDPAVARVIAQCLQFDPARRPASAIRVAAALPGGDPLYAALAAGETPSPEMVAAAGRSEGMRVGAAIACFAATAIALVLGALGSGPAFVASAASVDLPPEVLANKAREIMVRVSGFGKLAGSAAGFAYNASRPPPVYFWYRESPEPLVGQFDEQLGGGLSTFLGGGPPRLIRVDTTNPPPFEPGMRHVVLDTHGRMLEFGNVPTAAGATRDRQRPDWTALLSLTGVSTATLQPAEATWNPPMAFDERQAWTARAPGSGDMALRIEAASYLGRPVAFRVFGPSEAPESGWLRSVPERRSRRPRPLFAALTAIAGVFAWTNVRAGRSDWRGAFRLALVSLTLRMVAWGLTADHVSSGESILYRMALAQSVVQSMTAWLLYLAIEPSVRRRWPQTLISWSRALGGKLKDPLVGRDLAIGTTLSVVYFAAVVGLLVVAGTPSFTKDLDTLLDARHVVGALLLEIEGALEVTVLYCFSMLLFRIALRREWAVAIVGTLLAGVPAYFAGPFEGNLATGSVGVITGALLGAFLYVALATGGMIGVAAFWFTYRVLTLFPTNVDASTWYVGVSVLTVGTILALAAYASYAACARQLHGWTARAR